MTQMGRAKSILCFAASSINGKDPPKEHRYQTIIMVELLL
jgi:hypothetical protein